MREYWVTFKDALGFSRYVLLGRSVTAAGLLVAAYSYLASLVQVTWLPQISWFAFFCIVLLGTLMLTFFSYGHTLRLGKLPRVASANLELFDDQGWQCVRVRIRNDASDKIGSVKTQLDKLSDPDGAFGQGEYIDWSGQHQRLDYPYQLARWEMLPGEERPVEIFRFVREYGSWGLYLGKQPIITPPKAIFECSILGAGGLAKFTVEFAESNQPPGYSVILYDGQKKLVNRIGQSA